ncbi:hypothetical protein BGX29_001491 [Mortierella sp. GBA35]|nr:hypothetical protein BGX29_001491 [Mortierella sp. GBA35]
MHYMDSVLAFVNDSNNNGREVSSLTGGSIGTTLTLPRWVPKKPSSSMNPTTTAFTTTTAANIVPIPPITRLTHLDCNVTELNLGGADWGAIQSFQMCWFLRLNPWLVDLRLKNLFMSYKLVRVLTGTLPRLTRLRNVHLRGYNSITSALARSIFFSLPVSIVKATLTFYVDDREPAKVPVPVPVEVEQDDGDGDGGDGGDNGDDGGLVVVRTEPLHNLTQLALPTYQWGVNGYSTSDLAPFLKNSPALETWVVPRMRDSQATFEEVADLLRVHCPKLNKLGVLRGDHGHPRDFDVIVQMGMADNQLEKLTVVRCRELIYGDLWEKTLERHLLSLQEVVLFRCMGLSSFTIQRLLRFGSGLKWLVAVADAAYCENSVRISLEDASAFEWSCRNLTRLYLAIDFSGTHSDQKYADAAAMNFAASTNPAAAGDKLPFAWTEDEQECWAKLEKVYTQLGTLIHLEDLNLRYVNTRSGSYNSLAIPGLLTLGDPSMNQPGYLSKLAGLRRLKSFSGRSQRSLPSPG